MEELISLISTSLVYLLIIVSFVKFFKFLSIRKKFKENISSIILSRPDARKILENLIINSAGQEIKEAVYVGYGSDAVKNRDIAEIESDLRNKLLTFSQVEVQDYFLENVMSKKGHERGQEKSKAIYSRNYQDRDFAYMQKIGLAEELNDSLALAKIQEQYNIYKGNFRGLIEIILLAVLSGFFLILLGWTEAIFGS